MSTVAKSKEQRQFGRRQISVRGSAQIGRTTRAFTVRNISDGGALLVFDEDFTLPKSFRIEVEGGQGALQCEVRHMGPAGVGVQFQRVSEGAALNRQLRPVETAPGLVDPMPAVSPSAAPATVSTLDVRTSFLFAAARTLADQPAQPRRSWRHVARTLSIAVLGGRPATHATSEPFGTI